MVTVVVIGYTLMVILIITALYITISRNNPKRPAVLRLIVIGILMFCVVKITNDCIKLDAIMHTLVEE